MVNRDCIKQAVESKNFLGGTDLRCFGPKITGKVRDVYDFGDKMVFVTTDRQSAFDRSIALVPFKGQVLNQASCFWFRETKDIVPNHFLAAPDPNVVIGKKLKIFPIEFVVRGYLTGSTQTSIWTAYNNGDREYCGISLPEGLKKNQVFDNPLVTPTTKGEVDEKISADEIVDKKIMSLQHWRECRDLSLALFERGQSLVAKQGFILVDTKYEFGLDEKGQIVLADEVHTPDSSRFWMQDTYKKCFESGQDPENIDKEFLRKWLKEQCDPYVVETLPQIPDELIVELAARYITLYERTTGQAFVYRHGDINQQLENNVQHFLQLLKDAE